MWLLPQGLVNYMSAPAHEDRAVWAVNVALALASGRDGRGCHHTLRATARLVPDMLLLRYVTFQIKAQFGYFRKAHHHLWRCWRFGEEPMLRKKVMLSFLGLGLFLASAVGAWAEDKAATSWRPFDFSNGQVVFDVMLGGHPARALLDTMTWRELELARADLSVRARISGARYSCYPSLRDPPPLLRV